MILSVPQRDHGDVWIWLPGKVDPVPAGRLRASDGLVAFAYSETYLGRPNAIPLYLPELPLAEGYQPLSEGLAMPGCLRDAAPDAWGRRVADGLPRLEDDRASSSRHPEIGFLLGSGSDRIGALDFQVSSTSYHPRSPTAATLPDLAKAIARFEKGKPLSKAQHNALRYRCAIGGARPKAMVEDERAKRIAKFASPSDRHNVVKGEFVAMRLAVLCGIDAAPVSLVNVAGNDVLLIERFDRACTDNGWQRKAMVSVLTILALDEMMARYASYQDLARIIRHRFTNPEAGLREVFARIVFKVLCGNTDDHARNHAAFWDGSKLTLTPAYDICPQPRSGQEATQAMLIEGSDRMSRIVTCLAAAHDFQVSRAEALAIVATQLKVIGENWRRVCEETALGPADRAQLWGRSFLNPYAFTALEGDARIIKSTANQILVAGG